MVKAVHCEAKKHAFRQTQDGVIISFVLHPNEVPPSLALAPLGTRVMLAVAEIGDDEQPAPAREPVKNDAARERGRDLYLMADDGQRAVIRAGILPKDKAFQRWALSTNETEAAQFIRDTCDITSRSQLASNERAYKAFRDIEFQYHGHAEIRG